MTPTAILKSEDVSKRFGKLTALSSVSFTLEPGDFLTIFGRNGAGKSTLLNIVASLIRTYEGNVTLFGKNLRKGDESTRRSIGYISHDSFLYGDLTTFENLLFFAKLYGIAAPESAARTMLERVGLGAKTGVTVRDLSRGMKQRLSLGRAFLHGPKLLLLDEPYTGLDESACETLNDMLTEFVGRSGSVLMTTHDIDRGFRMAAKVSVLDRGSLVFESRTGETTAEEFRQTYQTILAE
jgi:heme ABC exporter ATP-binding subunit CcmA